MSRGILVEVEITQIQLNRLPVRAPVNWTLPTDVILLNQDSTSFLLPDDENVIYKYPFTGGVAAVAAVTVRGLMMIKYTGSAVLVSILETDGYTIHPGGSQLRVCLGMGGVRGLFPWTTHHEDHCRPPDDASRRWMYS